MSKILLLAALLSGCGPVDFTGVYRGPLESLVTCSDNSTQTNTNFVKWILNDNDGSLTFIPAESSIICQLVAGTVAGNVATITPKTCPQVTVNSGTFQDTIKSGSKLTLTADNLKAAIDLSTLINDPTIGTFTCHENITGTLLRSDN